MSLLHFETDKLEYSEKLESMRHIQRLEAMEMGFAVTAYGVLIAGLLNAGHEFFESWGLYVVCVVPVFMACLFIWHFTERRRSYYELWDRSDEFRQRLYGKPYRPKRKWPGFLMRIGMIVTLTLGALLIAVSRVRPSRSDVPGPLVAAGSLLFLLAFQWSKDLIVARLAKLRVPERLFQWSLVDSETELEITHEDQKKERVPYRQLADIVRRGDTIRVGQPPVAPIGPDTSVEITRTRANMVKKVHTTYRKLDRMVRYGDVILVKNGKDLPEIACISRRLAREFALSGRRPGGRAGGKG